MKTQSRLAVVTAVALLASCGGGGSGTQSSASSTSSNSGSSSSTGSSTSSTATTFTVGGNVYGLIEGTLVLQDNGGDNLSLTANGSFTFSTPIASGDSYAVTVLTQPTAQSCAVTQEASGTVSADVTGVEVDCQPTPTFGITEYSVPNVFAGLVEGHDGNLWTFSGTNSTPTYLVQISTTGATQSIPVTGAFGDVASVVPPLSGPDGNLWTAADTTGTGPQIGNVTLAGVSTSFGITGTAEVFDGYGNLWYAGSSGAVGSMTTAGSPVVTTSYANGISAMALGADGSVWFTSASGDVVGAISQSGVVTTYPLPVHADNVSPDGEQTGSQPAGIALGPDGNMWFVEQTSTERIGRITPSGTITEFTVNDPEEGDVLNANIAVGPDGNMWFTISDDEVGYITTSGENAVSTVPTANADPSSIITGPDGRMWFTEPTDAGAAVGKVGAVSLPDGLPTPSNTAFANAATLSDSQGIICSNNVSSAAESGGPIPLYKPLWWTWTAPSSGTLTLSTYGSSYETVVGVYTGNDLASLTAVSSSAANPADEEGSGLTNLQSIPVTQGNTYDIVVDGYNGASGVLLLEWSMQ